MSWFCNDMGDVGGESRSVEDYAVKEDEFVDDPSRLKSFPSQVVKKSFCRSPE